MKRSFIRKTEIIFSKNKGKKEENNQSIILKKRTNKNNNNNKERAHTHIHTHTQITHLQTNIFPIKKNQSSNKIFYNKKTI